MACVMAEATPKRAAIQPLQVETAVKRIWQIVAKIEASNKVDAEIADLLEEEILSGRWSGDIANLGNDQARRRRGRVKIGTSLVRDIRKRPSFYEDTDRWTEPRQALIGYVDAEGEAAQMTVYPPEIREAIKQSRLLTLDLIELMNPKNQDW
jgi:hypothetical protein